jgi:hypothetical protein
MGWFGPLLDAIAENADLLAKGDDNGLMNVAIAAAAMVPSGRSGRHRRSRLAERAATLQPHGGPTSGQCRTGPMAAMLRLLATRTAEHSHCVQRVALISSPSARCGGETRRQLWP